MKSDIVRVVLFFLALAVVLLAQPAVLRAEWVHHPAAVQQVYRDRVPPHTDRSGRPLDKYDADRSFFPIILYHALHGEHHGRRYDLRDYRAAGFNAFHPWEGQDLPATIRAAGEAGLQLIPHNPPDDVVRAFRDHPAVLGWYLDEEPTGRHWGDAMAARFDEFVKRRAAIRAIDPHHPVFALDVPWITEPATQWWTKWNTAGDVSVHDNYPINHRASLSFNQGIPESVSLAVKVNEQRKPVWVCVQAFEQNDQRFQFSMPTSRQLRCQVYAAVVHGATGIMCFALDSWVTRSGSVVGMATDPQTTYGQADGLVATTDQLRMSRELWTAAKQVNQELAELRPALLSPTAALEYRVELDSTWAPATPEPIRTLLKTHPAGGYVLLVVNIDAAPQPVRIVFPGHKYKVEQMFDAASAGRFTTRDDMMSFTAGPWAVHVIRILP